MYDVLVKNGKIVTADSVTDGNIAIKDGKIAAVLASGVEPEAAEAIDAKEKMPKRITYSPELLILMPI